MARLKVISMLVTIFSIVFATMLISNQVLARELQVFNPDYDVDYGYGDDTVTRSPLSDDDDGDYGPSGSPLSDDDYDDDGDYGPSGSPVSDDGMFVSPARQPLPAYFNFPTSTPLPDQCQTVQISESCGNTLLRLMLSKTLPAARDAGCCLEIIQISKYCWDPIIKTFESLNQAGYTDLYPWADNTWNTCVKLSIIN